MEKLFNYRNITTIRPIKMYTYTIYYLIVVLVYCDYDLIFSIEFSIRNRQNTTRRRHVRVIVRTYISTYTAVWRRSEFIFGRDLLKGEMDGWVGL